ncbi:MAG: signal peptidase I, partial [Lentisphaeria bacterium]|nr:signal peptidase I [Lentisphaeria bacterium]
AALGIAAVLYGMVRLAFVPDLMEYALVLRTTGDETADGILAAGAEITVPEGHFFALGDNTYNSLDGRNWGFIPRRNMIGLAVNIFWPVSRRWGLVDTPEPLDVDPGPVLDARKQPVGMNLQ